MSVNKVILVGNLGRDPEVRTTSNGSKVVQLSIATSERWRDRATGEQREKTEWHRVVIFNERLADVAERYLQRGRQVYIEGQLQTRKWQDQEGNDKYTTEIVLGQFRGELQMIGGRGEGGGGGGGGFNQDNGDFGGGSSGGGVGYLTAYNPSMVDRSHTRAVLLLAPPRAGVKEFANRVALSCECLVLCPGGLAPGMPPSRMAAEAWAAATYLNRQHGAQSLVVLAEGALVPPVVELVAAGDIPAHALAVLAGDGREAALREIGVPFLAVLAAEGSSAAQARRMRYNLALNSRLGRDYCVRDFSECGRDFVFAPQGETEVAAAEDALALVEAWVGRYAE